MLNQSEYPHVSRIKAALKPVVDVIGDGPSDEAATVYVRSLSRFPQPTLERGVQRVLDTYRFKKFPNVADFVTACDAIQQEAAPAMPPAQSTWLDKRRAEDEAITREAWAYADRFMTSTLGLQSIHEGWDYDLKAYVVAAASYIAQKLHGRQRAGLDIQTLCGNQSGDTDVARRHMRDFYDMARRSIAAGRIHVDGVPSEFIDRWRFTAERKAETQSR